MVSTTLVHTYEKPGDYIIEIDASGIPTGFETDLIGLSNVEIIENYQPDSFVVRYVQRFKKSFLLNTFKISNDFQTDTIITDYLNPAASADGNIYDFILSSLGDRKITYTLGGKEIQLTLSSAVNKKIGVNEFQGDTAYIQNIEGLSCVNQSFIKSIYIPNSIRELPDGFLSNAINLEYIYFDIDKAKPKLTKIGARAFYKSFKLRNLSFPDSLVEIGTDAFHDCINLKSVFFGKRKVDYDRQTTFNTDMLYINQENVTYQVQDEIMSYVLSNNYDITQTAPTQTASVPPGIDFAESISCGCGCGCCRHFK